MLSRKDFIKSCGSLACGAAVYGEAEAKTAGRCDPAELKEGTATLEAVRFRFAKLVDQITQGLPGGEGDHLIRNLGKECAATYKASLIDRFKGDVHGFLDEGRRRWMAETHYDEAAGSIRIVDRQTACVCPAVKQDTTPGGFCECTLGWQEAVYSAIFGRPVTAELEESILRGAKRCVYRIKVG